MSFADQQLQEAIDSVNNGKRNSGRTTRQAFSFIDQMLQFPEHPVKVYDHYDSPQSNREMAALICRILDAAGVPVTRLGETILEIPRL